MSGVIHKIKDALHGDKHHDSNAPLSNEHGTQSGVHDGSSSVAHGSSVSDTKPGVLHSTQYGIHGQRDPGTGTSDVTSGDKSRDTDTSRGTDSSRATEGEAGRLGDVSSTGATKSDAGTATATTGTSNTSTTGGSAGPQFTGDNSRDTDLVGSGLTHSGAKSGETGIGMAGTGYDERNRDTTLGGTGGVTGTGTTGTRGDIGGDTTTGSGLGTDKRDAGIVGGVAGEGLLAEEGRARGDMSSTATGSGLSGTRGERLGDQTSTAGSGIGGVGTGSDLGDSSNTATGTGLGGSTTGSGLGGSTTGTGLGGGIGSAEGRHVEGTERHYRGDGDPEDIVHEGPHVTSTAKALDPHFD